MAQTQINGGTQIRSGSVTGDRLAAGTVTDDRLASSFMKADGSTAFTANQSVGGNKLTDLAEPTSAQDAATKAYVDASAQGFDWKQSVRACTVYALELSSSLVGVNVDGVILAAGDRVLVKDQSPASENGIYVVNASGSPTRATDADTSAKLTAGATVFVGEGTVWGNTAHTLTTNDPITLGTTSLVFTQVAGYTSFNAGAGLSIAAGYEWNITAANSSIQVNADSIQVKLADASLEVNGSSGLRAKAGTAGQVYIANSSGVLTPTTLSGDVSSVSATGAVTLNNVLKAANYIVREAPSGSINGSNTTFVLANTPVSGSEQVFLNGILQEPGAGNDYTISGATITYLSAPVSGDRIRVTYLK